MRTWTRKVGARLARERGAIGPLTHGHTQDNISSNVAARSQELLQGLEQLARDSPIAGEVRGRGLIAAIELVADRHTRQPFPPSLGAGAFFCERARAHGVIVRAIGDTLACSVLSLPSVRAHHALLRLVATLCFQTVSGLAEKQALDSTGVVTGVCAMRLACGGAHDL